MQKSWTWGHSGPETDHEDDPATNGAASATHNGSGEPTTGERASAGDQIPAEDVRVAGAAPGGDDAVVTPLSAGTLYPPTAPQSEDLRDESPRDADTTGREDLGYEDLRNEDLEEDEAAPAAPRDEDEPVRGAVTSPAAEDETDEFDADPDADEVVSKVDEAERATGAAVVGGPAVVTADHEPGEAVGVSDVAVVPAETPPASQDVPGQRPPASDTQADRIEQLMEPSEASTFKTRWREVQSDFVDNPEDAVRRADELASEVLDSLIGSLNDYKNTLDERWHADQTEKSDTERLRQALRRYRDLFDRMLGV
jgi:hypothetical protein